jgi:hypothetical protein
MTNMTTPALEHVFDYHALLKPSVWIGKGPAYRAS